MHSIANLSIYLGAAVIYVLVPRYAGRPYETTKPFVAGWLGSLVFIATAYSHHLYMDFVQPTWADIVSEIASYGALIPVAVITIYSMTMLDLGLAIPGGRSPRRSSTSASPAGRSAGSGAVIDSIIPFNFRLHNTTWVVAHFHTYLILTVVVWGFAFLAHLIERDAGRTSSRARSSRWTVALILVGGYGLTGTWFVEGALGVPRRYAIQPPGTSGYSMVGAALRAAACARRSALHPPARPAGPRGSKPAPFLVGTSTAGPARTIDIAGRRGRTPRPRRGAAARPPRPAARKPGATRLRPRRLRGWAVCVLPSDRRGLRDEHPLPPPRPRGRFLLRRDARAAARLAAVRVAAAR